jgi:hypothetical protein
MQFTHLVWQFVAGISAAFMIVSSTVFSVGLAAPLNLKIEKKFDRSALTPQGQADIDEFLVQMRIGALAIIDAKDEVVRKEIITGIMKVADLGYDSNFSEANKVLLTLEKKYPEESIVMWQLSANYFFMATRIDGADAELKTENLRSGMKRSKKCLERIPDSPGCRLAYAALLGTLGLVEGIFDTISSMEEVSISLHLALELSKNKNFPMAPKGITSYHVALGAIAEFYRLVPDWWIFKMMAGVRGDKEKSWNYAKQIPLQNLGVANIIVRSALCWGGASEDMKVIETGLSRLAESMQLEMLHPFDEREYSRLTKLYRQLAALEDPDFDDYYDLGCKEFGNDEKETL